MMSRFWKNGKFNFNFVFKRKLLNNRPIQIKYNVPFQV